jgi:hypothetical protein
MFVNSIARFLLPWLGDFVSFRSLLLALTVTIALLALTVDLVVEYPYLYGLWVCGIYAANGGLYSPLTLFCGQIYGPKVGSQVFSLVSQGQNLSNLIMIPATLFLIQVSSRQPYGYGTAFCVLTIAPGLAAILIAVLRMDYRWEGEKLAEKLVR